MSRYTQSAVKELSELVKIPSVEAPALPLAPFGAEVRRALDYTNALAKRLGFNPVDVDGYAGYCEVNVGAKETVGVLVHLDVVPLGGGWAHAQGEIAEGRVWGRGAADDKGPAIACLYALRQLMDTGFQPARNIRIIWGCNEETGSKCMKYYKEHVGMPDIGFSPDADFPLISFEKTILHLELDVPAPDYIAEWTAGERPNVVPDTSKLVLDARIEGADCEEQDGKFVYRSCGRAAHAMNPELGESALWKSAELLRGISDTDDTQFDRLLALCSPYALEILGLDCSDEISGEQTMNFGKIRCKNGKATLTVDMRCPKCASVEKIVARLEEYFGVVLSVRYHAPYLSAERDGELYTKLYSLYCEKTNSKPEPIISGGGTYARSMKNCIAFGPCFNDLDNHLHDRDEFLDITHLDFLIDIYADAMKVLAEK